jgi:hypothetical protein
MSLVRRFLVLAALMFWQGGFTFYSAVVVPLGQELFGRKQGFLTREVTDYLNLSGAIALIILAWDVVVVPDRAARRYVRWLCWLLMSAGLVALAWLHVHMDRYFDFDEMRILERGAFRYEHRWYLWISTVQWGAALVYIVLMLLGWRNEQPAVTAAPARSADPPCPDPAMPP